MRKNVVILGSSGSVGKSTVQVLLDLRDRFHVTGLAVRRSIEELGKQCELLGPAVVAVGDETAYRVFIDGGTPDCVERVCCGTEGLVELATLPETEIVVNALVGGVGLRSTVEALRAGKRVALANKESLVMAGDIVLEAARAGGGEIVPVDSEHSAVFQLLEGKSPQSVKRILLTASGGPFREWEPEQLAHVTVEDALNHPTWNMGRKISIDSATLANKGLEVIEAHYLFGIDYDRIHVVVHPQSIVHSLVEFVDNSFWAHMSTPDMKIPIQYALTFPERVPMNNGSSDELQLGRLTFEDVKGDRFPTLAYAYEAGRRGGTAPAAFNAANEVAVDKFLQKTISFMEIADLIRWALDHHPFVENPDLDEILTVDGWTRETLKSWESGSRTA